MSNEATINWNEAMKYVDGDQEFLDEVLQDLLKEADAAEDDINDGLARNDFYKIGKAAHKVKGSALYLSCENIARVSKYMQNWGDDADKDPSLRTEYKKKIIAAFEEWKVYMRELRAEIAYHHGSRK
mmetsp:Transcript_75326/g.147827  ORF Transcript_75326/g.147827 Transcript_75326/m.147827 type:complete len:127 (+) Transcript_75326:70-450(+)|eukprot:CAMPEP_0170364340 /NCGR_PEP_ID=MMETSP0117_2-20130122/5321_1 /TAXON_ID=400756 /ORGANISM="Durinskia baltica, Strain CSIRO CS-38" /LENGTH=126 /DNA_ID=CAMNT_0010618833 /DNA_START=67 /DNA_END=447 /DNA_ORIENTATION=+